jgi:peptidoglycan lytic transglycosylase
VPRRAGAVRLPIAGATMNKTLLIACILAVSATGALAQGSCTQGVRIVSAWYGEGSHTASGQRFNPHGLTAAHRTFPFGTRLLVINPHNGKSVTVTINDRGPFVKGIGLDLSAGAAKVIGLTGTGAVCMAKLGVAG